MILFLLEIKDVEKNICKSCSNAQSKKYKSVNRDKYRTKNLEHYYNNKERYLENGKNWGKNNPEKLKKSKAKHYQKYKEKYKIEGDLWRNNNPEKVKASRVKSKAKRRSKEKSIGKSFTGKEWKALIILHNYTCLCCGKKEPEIKLTADHIIPISKDFTSNTINNIQPLCGHCNSSKGAKIIDYRPLGNIMATPSN